MKGFLKSLFYFEEENGEAQDQPKTQPQNQVSQQPREQVEQLSVAQTRYPKKERKAEKQPAVAQNNVVSLHTAIASNGAKVVLAEPRVYAEAQDIAENIKNKRATIVNLQRIDRESGIRIIDFLSGTVYALGGDIQRIGTDIFLCTPENVEVSGEISDYLYEEM